MVHSRETTLTARGLKSLNLSKRGLQAKKKISKKKKEKQKKVMVRQQALRLKHEQPSPAKVRPVVVESDQDEGKAHNEFIIIVRFCAPAQLYETLTDPQLCVEGIPKIR